MEELLTNLISAQSLAVLGGAIALAGGLAGSSIGIATAASAGAATLSEDPKQFRNVLLLSALPMTQTFYGLIILILFITLAIPNMGAFLPDTANGLGAGFALLACGIIGGVAQLVSAIYQGQVCASAISLLPKTKGKILTNGMMLAVFVELFGILGLVGTIIALVLTGMM
jgi:V/A-type H+-transporting ATPase subunit K